MKDKLAFHDRTVAVRIALADELEALCRSDGVDFIRRTLDSEINVIAGFDGCDEICGIRNLGHAALIGVGLGIRRTAGDAWAQLDANLATHDYTITHS